MDISMYFYAVIHHFFSYNILFTTFSRYLISDVFSTYIYIFFFFSSRRRHTRCSRDWSSDVCSSDLPRSRGARAEGIRDPGRGAEEARAHPRQDRRGDAEEVLRGERAARAEVREGRQAHRRRSGAGRGGEDGRKGAGAPLRAVRARRELSGGRHSVPSALEPHEAAHLRSEEHTSELQSRLHLVCRLLLEKKKKKTRRQKH